MSGFDFVTDLEDSALVQRERVIVERERISMVNFLDVL